jgi:hypothetical protein
VNKKVNGQNLTLHWLLHDVSADFFNVQQIDKIKLKTYRAVQSTGYFS